MKCVKSRRVSGITDLSAFAPLYWLIFNASTIESPLKRSVQKGPFGTEIVGQQVQSPQTDQVSPMEPFLYHFEEKHIKNSTNFFCSPFTFTWQSHLTFTGLLWACIYVRTNQRQCQVKMLLVTWQKHKTCKTIVTWKNDAKSVQSYFLFSGRLNEKNLLCMLLRVQ